MNQKPAADIPKDDDKLYRPAFCARQPIPDRKGGVWGYEVLFRDGLESRVAGARHKSRVRNAPGSIAVQHVSHGFE